MRTFYMQISKLTLIAGLALVLGTPATAATLFRWTTDQGTVSFTDDPKRVPARYRSAAKKLHTGGLGGYARFTPEDDSANDEYSRRLLERVEHLRENARVRRQAELARAERARGNATTVSLAGPGHTRFEVGVPTDDAPIVVDTVRVRPKGKLTSHHNTVVRQGDRILLVVRGEHDYQAGPSEVTPERELLQ